METDSSEHRQDPDSSWTEYMRFKRSYFYAALLPLTFVVGLASGFLIWGRTDSPEAGSPGVTSLPIAPTPVEQQPVRLEVSLDDDPALGPDDAQIVIVEFSDFNCPFCQRFHQETFTDLMDAYAGQIKFVYRDFPIVGGGQVGFEAARAANCAAEQGDYWAFHDALFSGRYNLDRNGFVQYASGLGMDQTLLEECLDSGRYDDEVQADFREGVELGVTGTPTFFINGIPLVGAQPLSSFVRVIEPELAPD